MLFCRVFLPCVQEIRFSPKYRFVSKILNVYCIIQRVQYQRYTDRQNFVLLSQSARAGTIDQSRDPGVHLCPVIVILQS